MPGEKYELRERFAQLVNVVMMTIPSALAWVALYNGKISWQTEALLPLSTAVLYITFGRIYEAFLLAVERIVEMVYSQMLAALVTDFFGFVIMWMVLGRLPNLAVIPVVLVTQAVVSTVWSFCAQRWYFSNFPPKRALVVADSDEGLLRLSRMTGLSQRFELVSRVTYEELMSDDERYLQGIDVVFLMQTPNAWRIMQLCAFKGIIVYRLPLISEIMASRSKAVNLFHTPMLRMDGYCPSFTYLLTKRCMDIVFSGAALLVLSPLMLCVAIAIKLSDGGPALYRQDRLTQGGKVFSVLKFRSMRVDAEKDGIARLSSGDADDRITPVGRWIRKLRIDELPQLINILKGEMSIVGPRPERPELTEKYASLMPEFKLRLLAKAGLTGYAQVYGKYNTTPEDKLQMDLMYLLHPSITEDLHIMFATVKVLFMAESTEGVAEGQTNAMHTERAQR